MISWLANHIGTIIVTFALAAIVLAIVRKLIKDKKQGKLSCGCNCADCVMAGTCHHTTDNGKK